MGIEFDFSEIRALESRMKSAAGHVGAKVAAVVRKTAHDIEADAKALAPVDTGNLRNSISTTVTGDGRHGTLTAEIGPTAEYGVYVEHGTSVQPGQPFLGPAFDRRAPGYTEALARVLEQGI